MLSNNAEIIMGQSPKAADVNTDGEGLPLLNGPTEFGPSHPTPVQFTTKVSKQCQEGDLLFCVRGSTTGRMNWADQPYAIGRGIAAIRHKHGKHMQPFLRAVIEHELPDLLVQATGSTFPNVSSVLLARVQWPNLHEIAQANASQYFQLLDAKIELLREMNQTLEETGRAVYRAWFADFEPIRAKGTGAPSFRGMPQDLFDTLPNGLEPSGAEEIPTGWRTAPLNELVSQPIKRGLAPNYVSESGVAVLNQKCVRNWHVNFELARRHDEVAKPLKDKSVELLDILVNSTGVGTLGRVAQVYELRETTTLDSHLSLVRPNPERISPILLGVNLTEREAEIERLGHGSTGQTELSRDKLGELPIVVPARNMQLAFDGLVTSLIERKTTNINEIATLAALRDALLPKFVSGELEAPSLEALGLEGGE